MSEAVRELMEKQSGYLPDLLGLEVLEAGHGLVRNRFTVQKHHMAPNGFLHAASVIALLDSAAGYGCKISLPQGASGFTTIELKTNFLGTAGEGATVLCEAKLVHAGRTTQVWDAQAIHAEAHKAIALFRCTQMVLYPR